MAERKSHSDDETPFSHSNSAGTTKRTIAIALDQSAYSEFSFKWALDNIIHDDDLVILLHVRAIPNSYFNSYYFTNNSNQSASNLTVEQDNRIESHLLLGYYVKLLKTRGVAFKAIAMRGDPREEIVRKVGEEHVNHLVVGSKGTGTVRRTLMGSLSDFLVHNVDVPVTVVKHPEPDAVERYGSHTLSENLRLEKMRALDQGIGKGIEKDVEGLKIQDEKESKGTSGAKGGKNEKEA